MKRFEINCTLASLTDPAIHRAIVKPASCASVSVSIQQIYPGSSSGEPLGRVGVGMALRRRGWRRCGVLLIPYIVTIYFINHIRILIISDSNGGLLTDMNNKIGAMPIFEGDALNRNNGHHRMINATKTTLNQKSKMVSHSNISTNSNAGCNSSSNATHPNCSSAVTPSPCDSLHKPSFGKESQTFLKFYGSGHVFSAHYDYREKIVQVSVFVPNHFSG